MNDEHTDDPTDALGLPGHDPVLDDADGREFPWSTPGSGAAQPGSRASRTPASTSGEGVRIIGADEAAAAIQAGQVAGRRPEDAPRFGDVPEPPPGPRPSLRFPGADPGSVAKPPVVPPAPASRSYAPRPSDEQLAGGGSWDDVVGGGRSKGTNTAGDQFFEGEPGPETPGQYPPRYVAGGYPDEGDLSEPLASGPTELPHWTEPPTGENPRVGAGPGPLDEPDDDLKAWSALSTGPRWRDQPTDWDEADFHESVLDDSGTRMGALRGATRDDDEFVAPPPRVTPPDPLDSDFLEDRAVGQPGLGPRGFPGEARRRTAAPASTSSGERDIPTAVITGVVALVVVLVAAFIGPGALALLVGVALVMAAAELYQAMRTRGYQPATLLGLAATASIVAGVYWRGEEAFGLILALFIVFSLLWYLTGVVRARPAMNAGATALGFLYVGFLGSFAALILKFPADNGIGVLLGAILATSAYDIGAFFVGRWAGKTPLAPQLSPHKTVEGLVGGTFATLFASLVVVRAIEPWNAGRAFWLAVIVAVAAPLGDLCESMIKRDLEVKDMGSLLPGHGGVFDRIDALLFVVPATYYLFRVL